MLIPISLIVTLDMVKCVKVHKQPCYADVPVRSNGTCKVRGTFHPSRMRAWFMRRFFFLEGGFMLSAVLRVSVRMTSSHQVLSSLHVHKLRP